METRELCGLFSSLLSYPSGSYTDDARRCLEVTRSTRPQAATAMGAFADFALASPPDRLEELFTAAFDLEPACCPYAGHHLFADPGKRSMMLVRLQQAYGGMGFCTGQELPDHVALLIRILPRLDAEARQEMEELVLGPTLEKMAEGLHKAGNPYENLVLAARQALAPPAEVQGAAAQEADVPLDPPISQRVQGAPDGGRPVPQRVQGAAPGGAWGVPTIPTPSTGTV